MAQGFVDLAQENTSEQKAALPAVSRGFFQPAAWLGLLILLAVGGIGLVAAHQVPASYAIDIAQAQDTYTLNNFYQLEKNEAGVYRWAQPQAWVHLLPLDSTLRVCLNIEEIFPVDRSAVLTLDTAAPPRPAFQVINLSKGPHEYCADTSRLAAFLPGDFTTYKDSFITNVWYGPALQIETDAYQPSGDRRGLGLLIHSIQVQSGAGAGKLGLPTLLEILVTLVVALGSWSLLRTFRLKPFAVLGLSLLPLAGWLGLVAFWRVGLAGKIEFALFMALATVAALFAARFVTPLILPDLARASYTLKNGRFLASIAAKSRQSSNKYRLFSLLLCGVALAIVLLGWLIPFFVSDLDAAWGFKRFAGLPGWLLTLLAAVAVVVTGWALSNVAFKPRFSWRLPHLNPYWWLALGGGAATLVFYLLRTQDRYGDSVELISKLNLFLRYRVETGRDDFLIWREREPLDFALHFLLWRGLLNFDWWKVEYTYVFTSVLAGGVFVAVAILLAANLTRLKAGRWLIAGMLLSPATLLVFFGYIESYTLVTLAALTYAFLGLLALLGRINIAWPALALIIAVMLHPQALFLGPSFVLVLLWRSEFFGKKGFDARLLGQEILVAGLVGATCVAAFALLGIMYNYSWQQWGVAQRQFGGSDNGSFKPLLASAVRPDSRELYPILSWDWLAFQLNLQMRLAPLALPLAALSGGFLLLNAKPKKGLLGWAVVGLGLLVFMVGLTWLGSQAVVSLVIVGLALQLVGLWLVRRQSLDGAGFFLGIMAAYTWLFSLVWNPDLGSNDWDLLSLNGIFTSLLAGYLVTKALGRYNRFGRVVVALLACALTLQAAWILYNTYFI